MREISVRMHPADQTVGLDGQTLMFLLFFFLSSFLFILFRPLLQHDDRTTTTVYRCVQETMAAGVFLPRKLIDSASLSAALFGLEDKIQELCGASFSFHFNYSPHRRSLSKIHFTLNDKLREF